MTNLTKVYNLLKYLLMPYRFGFVQGHTYLSQEQIKQVEDVLKLKMNDDLLVKVIKHYSDIWPYYTDRLSPLHGDLSLGNIIYNSDGIHIIDGEHFKFDVDP